jgi:hypothetical protein
MKKCHKIWINQAKHIPEYDPWELNVTRESSALEVGGFYIWTKEITEKVSIKYEIYRKKKK